MEPEELQLVVEALPFPDPSEADEHGLLAYGGDLLPERLLSAYARGIFPWYEQEPILWFSPDPRMVLLPDALWLPGDVYPVLGAHHFFGGSQISSDLYRLFSHVIAASEKV